MTSRRRPQAATRTPSDGSGRHTLQACRRREARYEERGGAAYALRQNAVTLRDATVLRLPLLGLRVAADAFFAQIADALVAGGWTPPDVIRSVGSDPQNV